jgi:hypothetical protein
MSVITAMAHNLRLELQARGILSLGRADGEAIIAAVVTNTAELAKAVETKSPGRPPRGEAGQPLGMRARPSRAWLCPAWLD